MQVIRGICIRVINGNVVAVPKDEIWKVTGCVNSKEKASEYDISASNFNSRDRRSTILGGGVRLRVDEGSQYNDPKILAGIVFKLQEKRWVSCRDCPISFLHISFKRR